MPFYDYWSTPFTPLKNLLSPNLGKSMSETCQDLERQSLNKLVFLTYSPFEIRKVSQFSILIDWWMKLNQDIPCKTKIYENSQCYQKNNNNTDNNNSNNNYQCRPRWDKFNLSLLLRLICNAGCFIIQISPGFGPKYFGFQTREKNITEVHYSSYLAKINPVSFAVIYDRMTNETKIKNLKKKFLQNKDWRKITRMKRNYDLVR